MRARGRERVLGPYAQANGHRVIEIGADGSRSSRLFKTHAKAERYVELLRAALTNEEHDTSTALDAYAVYLGEKGNKEASIDVTSWAIGLFFSTAIPLRLLSAKRCAKLYDELRTRPMERTKKPLAADTHRNVLAQTKSFLAWCIGKGWLRENPLEDVKGIGRRRPRGKSLGKDGNTLRVKEARVWFATAVELATRGDDGASAALVAMLLGMRASEIVSRRVGDLDEDAAPGDLLWIPCAKTPAGRRTLEVPDVLRSLLLRAAEGKANDRHLFEADRPREQKLKERIPHERGWVRAQVHRICDLAHLPKVTAHAMRGLLATLTAERGLAGHLIAATLGHENESVTMNAYAAPGSAAAGANRRGLVLLEGGRGRAKQSP